MDGQLDTAMVELPDVTSEQVENRTGWKLATDDCQLAHQDIQRSFRTGEKGQWTALTWDGAPAVCKVSQHQQPEELLVHGQTAYDLFIADTNGDDLLAYLH